MKTLQRKTLRRFLSIIAVIILLEGLVFAGVGIVWFHHVRNFVQAAEQADGTVIDLVAERVEKGGTVYYPVVAFTDKQGQRYEHRSSTGSNSPPAIGDNVRILYDRENPQSAKIDQWLYLYLGPGISFFIGVVSIFLAVVLFVTAWVLSRQKT